MLKNKKVHLFHHKARCMMYLCLSTSIKFLKFQWWFASEFFCFVPGLEFFISKYSETPEDRTQSTKTFMETQTSLLLSALEVILLKKTLNGWLSKTDNQQHNQLTGLSLYTWSLEWEHTLFRRSLSTSVQGHWTHMNTLLHLALHLSLQKKAWTQPPMSLPPLWYGAQPPTGLLGSGFVSCSQNQLHGER